jgi:hypothetical protein
MQSKNGFNVVKVNMNRDLQEPESATEVPCGRDMCFSTLFSLRVLFYFSVQNKLVLITSAPHHVLSCSSPSSS